MPPSQNQTDMLPIVAAIWASTRGNATQMSADAAVAVADDLKAALEAAAKKQEEKNAEAEKKHELSTAHSRG